MTGSLQDILQRKQKLKKKNLVFTVSDADCKEPMFYFNVELKNFLSQNFGFFPRFHEHIYNMLKTY